MVTIYVGGRVTLQADIKPPCLKNPRRRVGRPALQRLLRRAIQDGFFRLPYDIKGRGPTGPDLPHQDVTVYTREETKSVTLESSATNRAFDDLHQAILTTAGLTFKCAR